MLRYFLELFPTSKKVSKIGSKGCPKGPQKSTKIDRKRVQEGSRKGTSKGYPLQDQEKWDFAIIYYTLTKSEVSKKHIFGYHFGTVWETKSLKTGFQNSIKKSAENRHPFYEILGPFWGPFLSRKSVVCRSKNKCVLHVGPREAGYIKMGPKIDNAGS